MRLKRDPTRLHRQFRFPGLSVHREGTLLASLGWGYEGHPQKGERPFRTFMPSTGRVTLSKHTQSFIRQLLSAGL